MKDKKTIDSPIMLPIVDIVVENSSVKTFYFKHPLRSKPGQFVMLWIPGIDQKPFSVGYDDGNKFGLTIFKRGPLTEKLFGMNVGDRAGITGPYGTAFSILPNKRYIMVAGGYGAAPLGFLTEEVKKIGAKVDFFIGARNAEHLLFEKRILGAGANIHISTDDGSRGYMGFVTDLLEQYLSNDPERSNLIVCTCGPELMEKKVLDICTKYGVTSEISIERYMKCGFGICGQCCIDDLGISMCTQGPVVSGTTASQLSEFGNYHRDKSGTKKYLKTITKENRNLILKLHEINAIKFGEFKIKSGLLSPIYIDLRVIVSYPDVLDMVETAMWEKIKEKNFDIVCGVPYTALPIATAMSIKRRKPMVMRRKEIKKYGTKKIIEGSFEPGKNCLVIEDLITSGGSVFETIEPLEDVGLNITDIIVLLDREQGGKGNIENRGYHLHSVLTMTELLQTLREHDKIDESTYMKVSTFIQNTKIIINKEKPASKTNKMTYEKRSQLSTNPTAKRLFRLMDQKQTNLALSADLTKAADLLALADQVGPEICVLKTHVDIIVDFNTEFIIELQRIAERHNFLLFEDRKFADIGNTVKHQYQHGVHMIADWAHITNAHTVAGPGSIEGLKEIGLPKGRGLLILAEMTPKGTLATGAYTEASIEMAKTHSDFVIGFITTKRLTDNPAFIHMTPGVKLQTGEDALGQRYNTPEKVIAELGSDIIIVGRGIYQATNPTEEAKKYRAAAWQAYQSRII